MLNLRASTRVTSLKSAFNFQRRYLHDYSALAKSILQARVYDVARETPVDYAPALSEKLENNILLKREDLQPVFSFKIRGAYNKISQLSEAQKAAGVVACSAGNHAQGVALTAQHLGIKARIFMPTITPQIKIDNVLRLGAEVETIGNFFDETMAETVRHAQEKQMTLIHPFDDLHVIAGQGTIAVELLKQVHLNEVDAVFVCCGGGGMLAGIGAFIKDLFPHIKIIGAEAEDAPTMTACLREGKLVSLKEVGTFADGAAVKTAGKITYDICKKVVDDMVLVTTDEICGAIKDSFTDLRVVLEPAGALAVAGMKKYIHKNRVKGRTFIAICSGANIDFDRLRFVSERADTSERLIAIIIPEKPGTFRKVYDIIHPRIVTEFSYRMTAPHEKPGSEAYILLSFRSKSDEDSNRVLDSLKQAGFKPTDLQENEVAKVHGRHMIGASVGAPHDEVLYSFGFPQKPGALKAFLYSLSDEWNVSLFNYRDHGADIGRVLVGIQVPAHTQKAFEEFLQEMLRKGYVFKDESENEMYAEFIKRIPRKL